MNILPDEKNSRKVRRIHVIVILCLLIFVIPVFGNPEFSNSPQNSFSAASNPITIKLSLSKIPLVNEETTLNVIITSIFDAPWTDVEIFLPADTEIVSGTIAKKIQLKANSPESFDVKVKFSHSGDYKIIVKARKVIDTENSWGDMDALYVTIGNSISETRSFNPVYSGGVIRSPSIQSSNILETRNALYSDRDEEAADPDSFFITKNGSDRTPLGIGNATVRGKMSYYTKVVGGKIDDFRDSDDTLMPLKRAYVEIIDNSTGIRLGWGYTDSNGDFSITITNPYPNDFIIYWYAAAFYRDQNNVHQDLRIVNRGSTLENTDDVWSVSRSFPTPADGAISLDIGNWIITKGSDHEHAFMIFQDLINARDLMGYDVGSSTILWNATSTEGDTYYHGGQIRLRGESYKSADRVLEMFGYNYLWTKKGSITNTCPSPHNINVASNTQCAYIAGWSYFLPLAVNGNPVFTWPDGSIRNLETPTWGTPNFDNGDACEGRVAGALWDMYDTVNDGTDQYQFPFNNIDRTMKQNSGRTFSSYWNTWNSLGYSSNAVWSIYQNTINYRLADIPVVGYWNFDLNIDGGLYRPTTGVWYLDFNRDGQTDLNMKFGTLGDLPIVGDWNGDYITEIGIFRPSSGQFILNTNPVMRANFGSGHDIPISGDWNGDKKTDIGVFRPATRQFIFNTPAPIIRTTFGLSTDIPITGDWDSDGKTDIGVYRPSARQFILNTNPIIRINY